jgi:23S rRNA maturation mini-RNase III
MARRETRKAAIMGDLQNLSTTMEANKDLLADLEPLRLKFVGIVTQSLNIRKQQVAFQASKQESSKQLQKLLTEGQAMANVLRTAVKSHFGPREEKIVEFGLQPFRGRKVKAATEEPTPASTTPPETAGAATSVK